MIQSDLTSFMIASQSTQGQTLTPGGANQTSWQRPPPPCRNHPAETTLQRPPCRSYRAGNTLQRPPCRNHPAETTLQRPPCRDHLATLQRPPCRDPPIHGYIKRSDFCETKKREREGVRNYAFASYVTVQWNSHISIIQLPATGGGGITSGAWRSRYVAGTSPDGCRNVA